MKMSKFLKLICLISLSFTSCRTIGLGVVSAIQKHSQELAESAGNNSCYKASDFICEIEQEIHRLVNRHRVLNGLKQLTPHIGLSYVSRRWSIEQSQRGFINHDGFPVRRYEVYQREFEKKDVSFERENVALRFIFENESSREIAEKFVNVWIASPGHNANMLANGIKIFGAGVVHKGQEYYATLILGDEIRTNW